MRMRAVSGNGAVRFGVDGWRSANNSSRARSEKITTVIDAPMKESGEYVRFNQPKWAAQATTGGGVSERNPAVKPIPNANAKTKFIENRTSTRSIAAHKDENARALDTLLT